MYKVEEKESRECFGIKVFRKGIIEILYTWAYSEEEARQEISDKGYILAD